MQRPASQRQVPVAAALAALTAAGAALALAFTNPSLSDYEAHAGDQLVALLSKELCTSEGLPMVLRLWIRDCPQLVASQRKALAQLAGRFTTRVNLGVASLYTTRVGGQQLLPGFTLPTAEVVTLGIAGRFVLIRSDTDAGGLN